MNGFFCLENENKVYGEHPKRIAVFYTYTLFSFSRQKKPFISIIIIFEFPARAYHNR
jgi:hypothetical protein